MLRKYLALLLVTTPLLQTPVFAANLSIKDGNAVSQTLCARTMSDGSLSECNVLVDGANNIINPATKELEQQIITTLGTPFQAGGSIGNTSFGITGSLPTGTNTIGNIGNTGFAITGSLPTGTNTIGNIGNTGFAITGSLPAGSNSIGTIGNSGFAVTSALPTGSNTIGSIGNTAFGAKLQDNTGAAFGTTGNPIVIVPGTTAAATTTPSAGTATSTAVTPTSGTATFASGATTIGPFTPQLGRDLRVQLSGTWAGTVAFGTSTNSCATILPLTVGGQPWASFTGNANEVIDTPSLSGTSYCGTATLTSGTLTYSLRQ